MTDPENKPKPEKKTDECNGELGCSIDTLHESVSQQKPEWVDEHGECDSCVSFEHEMAADPTAIPPELDSE